MPPRQRQDASTRVLRALNALVRPIVRICLRVGISTGELRALVERAFVSEAVQFLRERGERASLVNVSAVSGIARQAVRQLMDAPLDDVMPRSDTQVHRAVRVLWGWHGDPEYCRATGEGLELDIVGPAPSFEALVKRYGGGVTYQSILERLAASGCIELVGQSKGGRGRVRVLRSDLHADGGAPETTDDLLLLLGDALRLASQLQRDAAVPELTSRTLSVAVPLSAGPIVSARLRRRTELLMQSMDEALQDVAVSPERVGNGDVGPMLEVRVSLLTGVSEALPADATLSTTDLRPGQRRPLKRGSGAGPVAGSTPMDRHLHDAKSKRR